MNKERWIKAVLAVRLLKELVRAAFIHLRLGARGAFIVATYRTLLKREPDHSGYQHFLSGMEGGGTELQAAAAENQRIARIPASLA